jgi:hypothetical protein
MPASYIFPFGWQAGLHLYSSAIQRIGVAAKAAKAIQP